MLISVLLSVIIVTLSAYIYNRFKFRNFPPGPTGIPILGYFPFLGSNPMKTFADLRCKYGNVYSLSLGSLPVVFLNDLSSIRNAFNMMEFSGRPKAVGGMRLVRGGISFNEGPDWVEQRKFTFTTLKDLGMGKPEYENVIRKEITLLVDHLRSSVGNRIALKETFEIAMINPLWLIVAGERHDVTDPDALYLHGLCHSGLVEPELLGPIGHLPRPVQMYLDWKGYCNEKIAVRALRENFQSLVRNHEKFLTPETENTFVNSYLQEICQTTDIISSFYGEKGRRNLIDVLTTLCTVGAGTTSTSLCWAIKFLFQHPKALEKLRKEIDFVVGTKRLPNITDRARMPYTQACITETLRVATIAGIAIMHSTMEDVEFQNYLLPKGTIVCGNLYQIHNSKEYWGDPENFRPERFISETGEFRKDENIVPFSIGKRICPAENLAMTNLFLFLTALVQNFDFEMDIKGNLPTVRNFTPVAILKNRIN